MLLNPSLTFYFKMLISTKAVIVALSSEFVYRLHEKLQNTVIHACKNITEKTIC